MNSTSAPSAAPRWRWLAAGKRAVVITSLRTPDVPGDELETLAVAPEVAWIAAPDLPLSPLPNRMDDAFSAIFLGALLRSGSVQEALEHATANLFTLVQATPPGCRDLALVAAQVAIVAPALRVAARSLARTTRVTQAETSPSALLGRIRCQAAPGLIEERKGAIGRAAFATR